MSNRAERRRQQRAGKKTDDKLPVRVGDLDERTQWEFAAALGREGLKTGKKVVDGNGVELTLEIVEEIEAYLAEPLDPPDVSVEWPENVAAHDQAASALLDLFTEEGVADDWTPQLDTLIGIGRAMPPHASVSVVLGGTDGHMLLTLLNDDNLGPVVVMRSYNEYDPWRMYDPDEANMMILEPGE